MKFFFKSNEFRVTKKLRRQMIFTWIASLIIPFLILFVYNYVMFGDKAVKIFTNPNFINKEIYQFEHLNSREFLSKEINNIVLENPEAILTSDFRKIMEAEYPPKEIPNSIIIIRKNEDIKKIIDLNTETEIINISKIKKVDNYSLPPFKSGKETNNQILFEKTGYVIARQIDFYFSNGDKGSAFILRKFTDIPAKMVHTVGSNLILLILTMITLHMLISYKMSKKFTIPISDMITATNEVRKGNYKCRINSGNTIILSDLSNSLNQMIIDLDEAQQYRNEIENSRAEFISSISHDLKTPITSIKIHAEAIKDKIVTTEEKMDKYINNILVKVEDTDKMLEELKIFNELETGIGNYSLILVKFDAFIEDIIEEMKYEFSPNNIILNFSTSSVNPYVNIDINKMKRVIWNIVNNSIKYANVNPIIIDFKISDFYNENLSKSLIHLSIKDNGIGVAKDKIPSIFKKYYRADESRNQNTPGNGLGLAISKAIINHHGGNIKAENSKPSGLNIIILLEKETEAVAK